MRLRTRFTLIATGITLFLIIAPALVLYAQGFKYDFSTNTIIKTGTLVADTRPGKADIYLNGANANNSTPATLRFIIPGDYTIRIEKENYQPWTKRLSIKSRLVTWANLSRNFIALFFNEPRLKETVIADQISLSRDRKSAGFIFGGQLRVLDMRNDAVRAAGPAPTATDYPSSEIRWQDTNQIFNIDNLSLLSSQQRAGIQEVQTSGSQAGLKINNDLYLLNRSELNLIATNVLAFSLESSGLWYVQNNFLNHYNIASAQTQTFYDLVPPASQGQVFHEADQIYLILDNVLYVLNDELERVHGPVLGIQWDSSSRQLLSFNTHELMVYVPDTKVSELVLRSLTPISHAVLSADLGYVLYASDNTIKAVELDGRDQRNNYTILKNLPIDARFSLSANGQILYIISETEIAKYQIW